MEKKSTLVKIYKNINLIYISQEYHIRYDRFNQTLANLIHYINLSKFLSLLSERSIFPQARLKPFTSSSIPLIWIINIFEKLQGRKGGEDHLPLITSIHYRIKEKILYDPPIYILCYDLWL